MDVLCLCFNEKLPAAGHLTFIFRKQWPDITVEDGHKITKKKKMGEHKMITPEQ